MARSEKPLRELESLGDGVCRNGHDSCAACPFAHGDGWQTLAVHHGLPGDTPETLRALAAQTGHPALMVYICDSDTGYVQGWSAQSGHFGTWYTPKLAAEYEVPTNICYEDETGMPSTAYQAAWDAAHGRIVSEMPQRARDACAWAEASGWRPDPAKVLEILLADRIHSAENHFFELLRAMGLPTADRPPRGNQSGGELPIAEDPRQSVPLPGPEPTYTVSPFASTSPAWHPKTGASTRRSTAPTEITGSVQFVTAALFGVQRGWLAAPGGINEHEGGRGHERSTHLERTRSILRSAYPDGLPESDYLPAVRVLVEGMSARNLKDVLAELTGREDMRVYIDATGVDARLSLTDPDVVRVKALLTRHGWDPDDDE